MAGFVKVNFFERRLNGEVHVYPIPCPAVKEHDGKRPSCVHGIPDEALSTCPFLFKTMALVEGRWLQHMDLEALMADLRLYPEERNSIRICCLRVEAGDTPVGAS